MKMNRFLLPALFCLPGLFFALSAAAQTDPPVIAYVTVQGAVGGKPTAAQTIRLTNCNITRLNQYGGGASPDKLMPGNNLLEEISLSYNTITIENGGAGTSANDTWPTRN